MGGQYGKRSLPRAVVVTSSKSHVANCDFKKNYISLTYDPNICGIWSKIINGNPNVIVLNG